MSLKERQKQLESMGISLETSGIKVGEDKCFLVNLNADPALNELLVYYLKVRQIYKKKSRLILLYTDQPQYKTCPCLVEHYIEFQELKKEVDIFLYCHLVEEYLIVLSVALQ